MRYKTKPKVLNRLHKVDRENMFISTIAEEFRVLQLREQSFRTIEFLLLMAPIFYREYEGEILKLSLLAITYHIYIEMNKCE